MDLPVIAKRIVDEAEFVRFWSSKYIDLRENLYSNNIGKPLTEDALLSLFEWKNGGPIAKQKLQSIRRNYIDSIPLAPSDSDRDACIEFISQPGGAIWRIFWLHCYAPDTYPIFDQHVFRAMKALLEGQISEIPYSNPAKAQAYIDDYLPFYKNFSHENKKKLDEALWSYGKFLKGRYAFAR